MDLTKLRVENYKSINDSGWVPLEEITCLVGKNESGKTAFMEAVEKLNPSYGSGEYREYKSFPRADWIEYENQRERGEPAAIVASAEFSLDETEIGEIHSEHRDGLLIEEDVIVKKDYDNNYHWEIELDESVYVEHFLDQYSFDHPQTEEKFRKAETIQELNEEVEESTSQSEVVGEIRTQIGGVSSEDIKNQIGANHLFDKLPRFRYMGDYSILDSIISIDDMVTKRDQEELTNADIVFMSLLSVANIDLEQLREEPDWEKIITRLEASSSHVTDYMMEYWTQNENVRIIFQREQATPQGPSKYREGTILQIRVQNVLKDVTIDFEQRSRGFRWFFSSFCHFSEIRESEENLILLLDEPGLHLHAKAQQDFLDFLDSELSTSHKVIYSTHSPFMIDPRQLHRAKLVMADPEGHTNITTDILKTDEDTRFPLQTVFEFDLIDTLLIRPQTLLVEGKSDQIYTYTMSEILDGLDKTGLDRKWTVLNVGSGDNIPSFVSLFGANDLDLAVLLDGDSDFKSRVGRIESIGEIEKENIRATTEYIDQEYGDIEDLFSERFYLKLVSDTYKSEFLADPDLPDTLNSSDFKSDNRNPRIVKRIEKYFSRMHINDGEFHHAEPARYLQRNRDSYIDELDEKSIENFENLFGDMNSILESFIDSD